MDKMQISITCTAEIQQRCQSGVNSILVIQWHKKKRKKRPEILFINQASLKRKYWFPEETTEYFSSENNTL